MLADSNYGKAIFLNSFGFFELCNRLVQIALTAIHHIGLPIMLQTR